MKRVICHAFLFLCAGILSTQQLFSQSVAINADSSKADPSAILDLKSTKKGLLVPRMTMAQRNVIGSPATGLLIYQTDNTAGYYYYTGIAWAPLQSGGSGTGNYWSANGNHIFNSNTGNVGIGTNLPSAKLMVKTPQDAIGFAHLGLTDSIGTDSVLLADKILGSYQVHAGGFTSTVPAIVSFGTTTPHELQLHTGNTGWLNLIPDGSVTIGDSAGTHGYFGSKLTVKAGAGTKAISVLTSDGALLSMYGSAVGSGIGTFTASDMNIYANSIPVITANGSGNVGINATSPVNKLQVGSTATTGITNYDFAVGNGTNATGIYLGPTYSEMTSSTNMGFFPKYGNGYFGINTNNPQNKFQIGNFGNLSYAGADFAIATGNDAFIMDANGMQSTSNFTLNPQGNVGIKTTQVPANKLQIGFLGPQGYNGNDIAFGNGYHTTAIAQTSDYVQIASSTNIGLLPKYGTGGYVGINTANPKAPLDVEGSASEEHYYRYYNNSANDNYTGYCNGCNATFSIYTPSAILAKEFDANSDARIKSVIGITNTTKDLQTITKIQVTDYTFKDKIANGSKLYKKVIAQQVEQIYPQVVSRHKDVVPNVYQLTSNIQKQSSGYLLTFAANHTINAAAKRLQVIWKDGKKQMVDIIAVPAANQVEIANIDLQTDTLFVYGEEVDDFRTVDYEGLTTLNISATQELNKELVELKKIMAAQDKKINGLERQLLVMKMKEKPIIKLSRFQKHRPVSKHRLPNYYGRKTSTRQPGTALAFN